MNNINISHIIKNSDSKFLKSLPNFVIKLIIKIFRQKELNKTINKCSDYDGIDFMTKFLEELNIKIEIEGQENLPENGKCFFVANHPFGLLDGIILTNIVGNKYKQIKIIGNEALMFIPNLRSIIANVSVFGKNPKKYFIELNKVFASDIPIIHFPFGLISRFYKFKIQDRSWKKSFITKAVANQRDVVPIKFYGRNSNLFYMVYIFRQILNIKLKIELILFPREMFKKKGESIKVKIGKSISYNVFDKSLSHTEWAQKVKNQVYKLN
ncbi:MAG: 1-acyl-sn-glycerol-3-phosphate acyltransferase [Bacteroidales bacterium]|nr:1-acyl-sn-glycerol-3-phosphate acyltransferase [Bacteroidales bacterium]